MKAKLIWMGISSILLIVRLGLIFFGLREINQAMASARWLLIDGLIVSSDLNVETDSDGNTYYRAKVRYDYGLDGQEFTGDRVYFGQTSTTNRKPVFDLLMKYEKGGRGRVLRPADPPRRCSSPDCMAPTDAPGHWGWLFGVWSGF